MSQENSNGSKTISFRTPYGEDYTEFCEQEGISLSEPLQQFLEFLMEDEDMQERISDSDYRHDTFRKEMEDMTAASDGSTPEKFGLTDERYGVLVQLGGEYLAERMRESGSYQEAMDIGQEIMDFDEELGDYLARTTVYIEEEYPELFNL